MTENVDYKDNDVSMWTEVDSKEVQDSDGFMTDYTWYTNGEKHIFMFGDKELYEPDEDYADWETESDVEARDWFDSYEGFIEEDNSFMDIEESYEDEPQGNANFMNDGFDRVYGDGLELED